MAMGSIMSSEVQGNYLKYIRRIGEIRIEGEAVYGEVHGGTVIE